MPTPHSRGAETPTATPTAGTASLHARAAVLLTAGEAAAQLGISKSTLYAYVSRGLLQAVPDPSDPRARRYSSYEVAMLLRRKGRTRERLQQSLAAVDEGWPLLDTALSCIADGQPHYRGQPVLLLAEQATLEEVARLLWQWGDADPFAAPAPAWGADWMALAARLRRAPVDQRVLPLMALALPVLETACPMGGPASAAHHLRAAAASFLARPLGSGPLHQEMARAWRLKAHQAGLLRQALVLSADHEMNMAGFVARGLASVGAGLGPALLGSMCSVTARFNGGATLQVEQLWDALEAATDLPGTVAHLVSHGQSLPGFNHLSYPAGDPRAAWLLARIPGPAPWQRWVAEVGRQTGWKPSVDLALVALRRAWGAPREAALCMQLAARSVGIIGHILEQQRSGQRLVARARYVGPMPASEAVFHKPARR